MTRRGIHSEDVLTALGSRGRRALSPKALLSELGGGRHQLKELRRVLRGLMADGRVERFQGRYRVARDDGLQEGTFQRARGGAQVVLGNGDVLDVPDDEAVGGAEDGNTVLVHVRGAESRGAWVIHVLSPTRSEWVGILDREPTGGSVTPYRDDASWGIRVARGDLGGARDGDVVVVDLQTRRRGAARGRVVEVLGPPGTPEADFRAVVWHRRLPTEFPEAALSEAEACPDALDSREARRRMDLRDKPFVTIDPQTARDHDDAVCVEVPAGRSDPAALWVAIADVAHYVAEGSALDAEALRRGNSVYFPDRAIPMLPERLSGGLCSLRPDEDRFAMVVELRVDAQGEVTRTRFHRAVIRSRARLAYEDAAAAIEGEAPDGMPPEAVEQVRALADVTRRLRRRRFAAGCIDFELPSGRVVLDAAGLPVDVVIEERNEAHRAIEDAMLAANRAVSRALGGARVPALYRVHEPPAPGDLETLCETLESFGLLEKRREAGVLSPGDLGRALARAAGRPEERLVNTVALRAMRRARYGERDVGHYALGFDSYTHFTSPIRRYADLVVHRALHRLLEGSSKAAEPRDDLAALAARVSMRERVAEAAERDMVALKKCAFMAERLGEEFDGTITGVARHGFYVTLDRWFVEGLVHVATLAGYAVLDERAHALVIRGSRQRWRLGDRVRVIVDSVDRAKGWVNFALVAPGPL